jgi:hypothetical protein
MLSAGSLQANVQSLSTVMSSADGESLVQALSVNAQARDNAERLTTALRQMGAIKANERVVGVMDGKIYTIAMVQ